ncbi:unnamed protein product [Taenia asiatica]|uniref:WH2 domain-containing protein n=1 Tax=Taenia asiatica TaxID=60517 RepID=A0A158R6P9_TAEAS|nr:unnamed protein product [Taenia asiatica]
MRMASTEGSFVPVRAPHSTVTVTPTRKNDNGPRSASVGRPTINGTPQRIVTSCGGEEVILRRPTTNGACTTSISARQRPQTTTSNAKDASSFYTSSVVTPVDPSPNHRHSTCTLQQLNDTLLSSGEETNDMKVSNITGLTENEEADEEEETASGTLDDETSDDGVLSDEHRLSNGGGENALNGSDELGRSALSNALTREHRSLSRGGDPQTMLYPDQSLPPPVYTNLNKLTHAAQRKFSMSTNVASNTPGVDVDVVTWQPIDEGDNLSIASAPHVQPEQKATNGGVYSVPGSPHRPSLSTSSSNSRPRGGSTGVEDPFSIEMDELDRMVTELHSLNNYHTPRLNSPKYTNSISGSSTLTSRSMTHTEDLVFSQPSLYHNQSFIDFTEAGEEKVERNFILPPPPAPPKPRLRAGSEAPIRSLIKNTRSVSSLAGKASLPPPVPFRSSSLRRISKPRAP